MQTWNDFIKNNQRPILIAIDTEYQGNTTLTVQV